MKITKAQLKQIIKEEIESALGSATDTDATGTASAKMVEEMKKIVELVDELYKKVKWKRESSWDEGDIWVEELRRIIRDRLFRVERGELGRPTGRVQQSIGRTFGKMFKKFGKFVGEIGALMAHATGLAALTQKAGLREAVSPESAHKQLVRKLENALMVHPPTEEKYKKYVGELISQISSLSEIEDILDALAEGARTLFYVDVRYDTRRGPGGRESKLPVTIFKDPRKEVPRDLMWLWQEADEKYKLSIKSEVDREATDALEQYESTRNILDDILMRIRSPLLKPVYLRDIEELIQDIRTRLDGVSRAADNWAILQREDY